MPVLAANMEMMTQRIFRRDEMWLVRRNAVGESSLVSLADYEDIRFDKDVRKSYLEGRLGGIPHISPRMDFGELECHDFQARRIHIAHSLLVNDNK